MSAPAAPPNVLSRLRAGEPHLSLTGEGDDAVPAVCGVSRSTPSHWRDNGVRRPDGSREYLPAFSKGRGWFVFETDLEAFLTSPPVAEETEPATPAAAPAAVKADAELAAAGW